MLEPLLSLTEPLLREATLASCPRIAQASQQQRDDRSREQLREQVDKDRVALAHAQKKNETLEEGNRKLMAQVKELEGKVRIRISIWTPVAAHQMRWMSLGMEGVLGQSRRPRLGSFGFCCKALLLCLSRM